MRKKTEEEAVSKTIGAAFFIDFFLLPEKRGQNNRLR